MREKIVSQSNACVWGPQMNDWKKIFPISMMQLVLVSDSTGVRILLTRIISLCCPLSHITTAALWWTTGLSGRPDYSQAGKQLIMTQWSQHTDSGDDLLRKYCLSLCSQEVSGWFSTWCNITNTSEVVNRSCFPLRSIKHINRTNRRQDLKLSELVWSSS